MGVHFSSPLSQAAWPTMGFLPLLRRFPPSCHVPCCSLTDARIFVAIPFMSTSRQTQEALLLSGGMTGLSLMSSGVVRVGSFAHVLVTAIPSPSFSSTLAPCGFSTLCLFLRPLLLLHVGGKWVHAEPPARHLTTGLASHHHLLASLGGETETSDHR